MNVLDLFSGIGGFSLGLERAGMRTVAFCEIDPFCRRVLAKHWPAVPCYDDVRTLTAGRLAADGIAIDLICGGFPCQDISIAGKGAGIDGDRSGLWSEYARIIGEVRPGYVVVENVSALLHRGLERVLGDLAAFGFDAEWHCIPASAVGAPHRRDRVWIIAHAIGHELRQQPRRWDGACRPGQGIARDDGAPRVVADTHTGRCSVRRQSQAFPDRLLSGRDLSRRDAWNSESGVRRVADGVPDRVDRIGALGNAVVPQIPEIIGRAILEAQKSC